MKILFDHNVPKKLRLRLHDHFIRTAKEMDWAELANGDLLRAAEENGFEIMLTCDRNLFYQQNLVSRKLALLVLSTNNWNLLKHHVERIAQAIRDAEQGCFAYIEIGE